VAVDDPTLRLAAVFSENADFVWRSLRRLGVSDADVDDAVQEVFLIVHQSLADYEERGLLRAWLYAIGRQVANHYRRGRSRAQRRQRALIADATTQDPHELMARRQAVDLVQVFLETLDEPQRDVFYLADIEGLTAPEISAALGMKLNTVYSRLRLARKRFDKAVSDRLAKEALDG
jgi:RNA polymerase sigma-70 factor (ECF subfamily)